MSTNPIPVPPVDPLPDLTDPVPGENIPETDPDLDPTPAPAPDPDEDPNEQLPH